MNDPQSLVYVCVCVSEIVFAILSMAYMGHACWGARLERAVAPREPTPVLHSRDGRGSMLSSSSWCPCWSAAVEVENGVLREIFRRNPQGRARNHSSLLAPKHKYPKVAKANTL